MKLQKGLEKCFSRMLFHARGQRLVIWQLPTQSISNQTQRKLSKGIIKSGFQTQLGSFNKKSCFFFLRENYIFLTTWRKQETAVTKLLALKLIVSVPPLLFCASSNHSGTAWFILNNVHIRLMTVIRYLLSYSQYQPIRQRNGPAALVCRLVLSWFFSLLGWFLEIFFCKNWSKTTNKTKPISGSLNERADTVSCHRWLQGSLYVLTKPLGATFCLDGPDLKKLKSDVKH